MSTELANLEKMSEISFFNTFLTGLKDLNSLYPDRVNFFITSKLLSDLTSLSFNVQLEFAPGEYIEIMSQDNNVFYQAHVFEDTISFETQEILINVISDVILDLIQYTYNAVENGKFLSPGLWKDFDSPIPVSFDFEVVK